MDWTQAPDGWWLARLGDVAEVNRGVTWAREQESDTPLGDTVPVVRIGNVQPSGFKMDNTLYIRGVSNAERIRRSIREKTLVMVGSNGNRDRVGNIFLANSQVNGHLLASFLIGIEPSAGISERFLSAYLRSVPIQSLITESTAGSTGLKNLSLTWLRNLQLKLPPLPEQQAIAAVLDFIDDAIERTEEVIAATERLRDALLHELLTRGVPGLHTEWKEAPGIGTIPACWDVVRLGDEIEDGPTNGIYKPESEYGSGTCIIRIDDFIPGSLVSTKDFQRILVTEEERRRYLVSKDDILINRVNSLSHIAKSVLIPQLGEPTLFESNMIKLRMCDDVQPKFAASVLLSRNCRQYFISRAKKAVQQASVNQQDVSEMPFPLPNLAEQQAIAAALEGVNEAIVRGRMGTNMLKSLKASAADALLTGRVRVEMGERIHDQ